MPNLKASEEFVLGKHSIGYVDSQFTEFCKDIQFDSRTTPTFQKLERSMNDASIESELKPGLCTLGDVLAFIENPQDGTKDGWSNLFYFQAFVVLVGWGSWHGRWGVDAYRRDGIEWHDGVRVFSPATDISGTLGTSTLSLDNFENVYSTYKHKKVGIEAVLRNGKVVVSIKNVFGKELNADELRKIIDALVDIASIL